MKFENTAVFNLEGALRGMRFPLQSHAKADSKYCTPNDCVKCHFGNHTDESACKWWQTCTGEDIDWQQPYYIGENDMDLAQRLIGAGAEHAKFMRSIFVSVDITAPMYWWSEADTYKVGTVANSTSKMHKLASTPITLNCFETDDYNGSLLVYDREPYNENFTTDDIWEEIINHCETLRQRYNETKDKRYWKELIRILPESWLQTRTWSANYAVLRNIIKQRSNHKLLEWREFIGFCRTLPYSKELLFYKLENNDE